MKLWSLTLLVAAQLLGPVEEGSNKEGNDAYAAGELDDALTSYTQAQVEHPDARELHYNIGNVQFRKEDLDKALEQYKMALDAEPELKRRAHYNVGNIHYSREEWEDAVESYSDALRADPDDIDARQNLELALQKLSEQQQQQEGGGGDADKDKDKDKDKEDRGRGRGRGRPVARQEPGAGRKLGRANRARKIPTAFSAGAGRRRAKCRAAADGNEPRRGRANSSGPRPDGAAATNGAAAKTEGEGAR